MHGTKTKTVEQWWDKHPFSYGIAGTNTDQVGAVADEAMTLAYFDRLTAKFKQHGGVQNPGADTRPILSELIDYNSLRGEKVLDIATGPGLFLVEFAKAGATATGIDITSYAIKHASRNLALRGLEADVLKMDAQDMTFPDNTFDYVHAWGCVMHMPDTERAIAEIHRVLKPGGTALIYVYNRNSWTFWFNFILLRGIFLGGLIRYGFDVNRLTSRFADDASVGGSPLAKYYSKRALTQMVAQAGFRSARYTIWGRESEPEGWPVRSFAICTYLPRRVRYWLSSKIGLALIALVTK
jgi:ubiquinone/menaquinone biosynthesis C-methylase UbiE